MESGTFTHLGDLESGQNKRHEAMNGWTTDIGDQCHTRIVAISAFDKCNRDKEDSTKISRYPGARSNHLLLPPIPGFNHADPDVQKHGQTPSWSRREARKPDDKWCCLKKQRCSSPTLKGNNNNAEKRLYWSLSGRQLVPARTKKNCS